MACDGFQLFRSDNGTQIVVHFAYERGFEGISIGNAWTRDEEHDFELTQAERDRFEVWIMERRSNDDQSAHVAGCAELDASGKRSSPTGAPT